MKFKGASTVGVIGKTNAGKIWRKNDKNVSCIPDNAPVIFNISEITYYYVNLEER